MELGRRQAQSRSEGIEIRDQELPAPWPDAASRPARTLGARRRPRNPGRYVTEGAGLRVGAFPIDDLGVNRIRPGGDAHHRTDREHGGTPTEGDLGEVIEAEWAAAVAVATDVVPEVHGVEGDSGVHGHRASRDDRFEIAPQPVTLYVGYGAIAFRHGGAQQGPFPVRIRHLRPAAGRQRRLRPPRSSTVAGTCESPPMTPPPRFSRRGLKCGNPGRVCPPGTFRKHFRHFPVVDSDSYRALNACARTALAAVPSETAPPEVFYGVTQLIPRPAPAPESPHTPHDESSEKDQTPEASAPCTRPPGNTPDPEPAPPGRRRRRRCGGRRGPRGT